MSIGIDPVSTPTDLTATQTHLVARCVHRLSRAPAGFARRASTGTFGIF
jgi:hypothetical protein